MEFKKLESKKKSNYVVKQIMQVIRNGTYGVGDKLPTELKIAEETGVSRTSVREALNVLRIAGIIESHPGDGTYIRKTVNDKSLTFQLTSILEECDSPYDIWEARKYFEASIVDLVIDKLNDENSEKLEGIIEIMQEVLEKADYDGYLEMNKSFHIKLAEVTGNELIESLLKTLLEHSNQLLTNKISLMYVKDEAKRSLKKHKNIFEAIVNKDIEKARSAIMVHFDELENYLGKNYLY